MESTTKNPLKLSHRFVSYLEKHRIYELFQELSTMLLIKKPDDHVLFLKQIVHHASRRLDAPRIIILAPPGCDKLQLAGTLRERLQVPLITLDDIVGYRGSISPLDASSVLENLRVLLANYMSFDCDGWILIDFPRNEKEARSLLRTGIIPSHVIEILSSDKKNDSQLKTYFHREIKGLRQIFSKYIQTVNMRNESVDQVTEKCLNLFNQRNYSRTPTTLRILLLNFVNEERNKCLGLKLAEEFDVTYIDFSQVLEQVSLQETDLGDKLREMKESTDLNKAPSEIKTKVFEYFLLQSDGLKKGWLLVGFVSNVDDFMRLDLTDFPPNRVVIIVHEKPADPGGSSSCICSYCPSDSIISDSSTAELLCACDENWDRVREYAGKTAYVIQNHDDLNVTREKIQSYLMLPPPCVPARVPRPVPEIKPEEIEFEPDDEPSTNVLACIRRAEPLLALI